MNKRMFTKEKLFAKFLKKHFPPNHLHNLVPGVRFERKQYGFDLWWNPTGRRRRSNSIYFGRIGKRVLDKIVDQPDRDDQLRQIVLSKMAEKMIAATSYLGHRLFLRQ